MSHARKHEAPITKALLRPAFLCMEQDSNNHFCIRREGHTGHHECRQGAKWGDVRRKA